MSQRRVARRRVTRCGAPRRGRAGGGAPARHGGASTAAGPAASTSLSGWRRHYTPFQRRVYEAILTIPRGQVRTYGQVARMIGRPRAARAVGQALKANRWAPAIPCHRVVAGDGTLGGYSAPGGLRRKRRLLQREGWRDER